MLPSGVGYTTIPTIIIRVKRRFLRLKKAY